METARVLPSRGCASLAGGGLWLLHLVVDFLL